jgi:hypothetical protein
MEVETFFGSTIKMFWLGKVTDSEAIPFNAGPDNEAREISSRQCSDRERRVRPRRKTLHGSDDSVIMETRRSGPV